MKSIRSVIQQVHKFFFTAVSLVTCATLHAQSVIIASNAAEATQDVSASTQSNVSAGSPSGAQSSSPQTANTSATHPGANVPDGNFAQRLGSFYSQELERHLPSGPASVRRALDAPLDSAPFPNSDWG
jgi:hypothetical protein